MTGHVELNADRDADVRWRAWQARGAASDRLTATRTRYVMWLGVMALAGWALFQLG